MESSHSRPAGARAQNIEKHVFFEIVLQQSNENHWFLPPPRGAPPFWLRGVQLVGSDVQKINGNQVFLINFLELEEVRNRERQGVEAVLVFWTGSLAILVG